MASTKRLESLIRPKAEKREVYVELKTVKKGTDISSWPDAVVDGVLTVVTGSQVYFERYREGKVRVHVGTVKCVRADGTVDVYDETLANWYGFSVSEPGVIKVKPT